MKIALDLPDDFVNLMGLQPDAAPAQVKMELACALYARNLLSCGRAARLAGMDRIHFWEELGNRNIPLHYSEADLAQDLDYASL